jgi:hypothetical protein
MPGSALAAGNLTRLLEGAGDFARSEGHGYGGPDSLSGAAYERYDAGMTRSKIAISLPKDQLARVHREVRAGRADSVSGYIARVLAEHEKRESVQVLLRDLIEQYGEPGAEDIKWAERALPPRRRG